MIYLDNAATTRIDDEVFAEMEPWLKDSYGNAGGKYKLGKQASNAIGVARDKVARFIGCSPNNIIFTSGGSEANTLAIASSKAPMKFHAVQFGGEHHSVVNAIKDVYSGCTVVNRTRDGDDELFVGNIENAITSNTSVVSVMYVNNETGIINPVKQIADVCRGRRVLFHTDCVQAAECEPIDVTYIGCDFASISGHKIHAPKGIGALYAKNMNTVKPVIHGGDAQEFGKRGGTENVASIVGFGKACEIAQRDLQKTAEKVAQIKLRFYNEIMHNLSLHSKENIVHINGIMPEYVGKILNLSFDGIDSETLLMALDYCGVCASAGSACNSHDSKPSYVLVNYGLTPEQARSSVRFSFSKYNTEQEVIDAARIVSECIITLTNI